MRKIIPYFYLAIFGAFILYMNACYHFASDDCAYGLQHLQRSDVLPLHGSIITAWHENWADGYRPIPHLFARIFCGCFPKLVFNIANTLMLLMLILCVCRYATGTWRLSKSKLVLAIASVYIFLCKGESYLWCAGSLNYLWVAVPTIAFLILRDHVEQGTLSVMKTLSAMPLAFLCGWLQEACVLPVCFALCVYGLLTIRLLTWKKAAVYGAYGLGAVLLVCSTVWRAIASDGVDVSFMEFALNLIKILWNVKVLWLLGFVVLFSNNRIVWVKANGFALLVILGSLMMIGIVGFNGERSLYAANLMGVVLLLRRIELSSHVTSFLTCAFVGLMLALIPLASRIKANFEECLLMYRQSSDGVAIHERVDLGVFNRYFYQVIYNWQQKGHTLSFSDFYGAGKPLCALSRNMYENLYLNNRVCSQENKLPITGNFYAPEGENCIVMPVDSECKLTPKTHYSVLKYEEPCSLFERVRYELELRHRPSVPYPESFYRLRTLHGDFIFLVQNPFAQTTLKSISFVAKKQL